MQLCALPGVSSWEDAVRDAIKERAERYADEVRTDPLGNLIVWKKGKKAAPIRLLLAAHMDEVGLMVRKITDERYLKFDPVGSVDRRGLIGKPVRVGEKGLPGVIGLKAYHLVDKQEEKSVPKLESFYLDIGAKDRSEAEKLAAPGDAVVFSTLPELFGENLLKAKALESRVGCAVLLKLLEEELPVDCTFAFTAQKEVGARGAFGTGFSVKPAVALVLDGAAAMDIPGAPASAGSCRLGKGAVITYMDHGAIADAGLFDTLRTLAQANEIPWQIQASGADRGDATALQRAGCGVRTAFLSVPVRYPKSPAAVAHLGDMEAVLRLSRAFLAHMGQ